MTSHTNKRAIHASPYYQPTITSFFTAGSPASSATNDTKKPSYEQGQQSWGSSHLPTTTQQNLLQVGMRVRKSIMDGYKLTAPTPSAYSYVKSGAAVRDAYYCQEDMALPSSQDSTLSNMSSMSGPSKKRLGDDSDDELEDAEEEEQGNLILPPTTLPRRPILPPRRRSKGQRGFYAAVERKADVGDYAMMDVSEDFGEAGFLVGKGEL